jgi:hypothetical protein
MFLIQPCCALKHIGILRDTIGKNGAMTFEGRGDLSLTELLPAMLMRYAETNMVITAPTMPDQAADIIGHWMKKQWAKMSGRGKLNVIGHLTIITSTDERKSPIMAAWKKDNPFGERLTIIDRKQDETVLLLPDFAIAGPVNMRYNAPFKAKATTVKEEIDALWGKYGLAGEPQGATGKAEGHDGLAGEPHSCP